MCSGGAAISFVKGEVKGQTNPFRVPWTAVLSPKGVVVLAATVKKKEKGNDEPLKAGKEAEALIKQR